MEGDSAEGDSMYDEVGNYFFNNEELHDVEFIVGEEQKRIKAIKSLLINQSKVWWSMLSKDSPLAEKGDIYLPDIEPEVFSLVLKHSYGGLESLVSLSNEIVMKLCYCANKYDMKTLMTKIATRLDPKDVDGLFPALHCLAYYNLKGVEDGVQEIIRTEITKIFEHPEFLECDVDSVTYICKQETLNCDELTLWKAVVDWAKHKAGDAGEGAQLRKWMAQPLQHIRLMSLSVEDFYNHVLPLEVLTSKEIAAICKGDLSDMPTFCNSKVVRYFEKTVGIKQNKGKSEYRTLSCSSISIKDKSILLKSITARSYLGDESNYAFDLNKISTDVTITISRVANVKNTANTNNLKEDSVLLKVNGIQHYPFELVTIPTLVNGKGITLLANNKYKIEIKFSEFFRAWCQPDCSQGHDFDHGTFYCSWDYINGVGQSPCHIQQFTYRLAVE